MDHLKVSLQLLRQASRIMNRMRYKSEQHALGEIMQVINALKVAEKFILQEISSKETK